MLSNKHLFDHTFFISDYHFCHELARIRSRQEFVCVEEMNQYIIDKHNARVGEDDTIYILGDVIICDEVDLRDCMNQTLGKMNGHKHLILGNHDYKFQDDDDFLKYFDSVQESKTFRIGSQWVQLYHYPVLRWYRKNKGGIHIYGHMHNETKGEEFQILSREPFAVNVSVEVVDYTPVSLREIVKKCTQAEC